METDRGKLHKIPPRREHEKEELVSVETESVKSRLHAVPDVNIFVYFDIRLWGRTIELLWSALSLVQTDLCLAQPRLPDGGGGGGVRRAVGDSHLLLPPTLQDGRLLQGSALLPRGHQLHLPQLRDRSLPPPDLPEGPDSQDGLLADTGARYFTRYDPSDNF